LDIQFGKPIDYFLEYLFAHFRLQLFCVQKIGNENWGWMAIGEEIVEGGGKILNLDGILKV
jgi:hypothetical protein